MLAAQAAIVAVALIAWEFLPKIAWLSERYRFLNKFFISSPAKTFDRVLDMGLGRDGSFLVWEYLWRTIFAAMIGVVIGVVLGAAAGVLLSNAPFLNRVVHPFIVAINATPRVAFIPVIVIMFGPSRGSSIAVSVLVVFFVVFFNAYEGGSTVAPHIVQNAKILGASDLTILWRVRLPYVLAWTMAAFPVAIAFSLVSVVTAEVLTGYAGLGRLITTATTNVDSSLTFAVVVYLAVIGAVIVGLAEWVKRRALHWWIAGG